MTNINFYKTKISLMFMPFRLRCLLLRWRFHSANAVSRWWRSCLESRRLIWSCCREVPLSPCVHQSSNWTEPGHWCWQRKTSRSCEATRTSVVKLNTFSTNLISTKRVSSVSHSNQQSRKLRASRATKIQFPLLNKCPSDNISTVFHWLIVLVIIMVLCCPHKG